ncbi:SixA phosphatase family protein [Altericroceibacterium xinjiangense]|uniref:SixA phosphatase family protein n=1 Tax=Altericroceibacterium xinjiangense TaxID=762261 RepID=UPI000F7F6495|nr:histidine phosphatase family protein [Altericroceibacterium xinjiangense]
MKLLGLLRHAKSDWTTLRDFDRGLNDRGKRGAALMGRHIREHGVSWDTLVASPAERVRRTLELAHLKTAAQWEPRAYLADEETLLDIVRAAPGSSDSLLVAGHNPGLQDLIFSLVGEEREGALFDTVAEKYPTATFAVLELDITRWIDCTPGCGRLVHIARPRDLSPELGPLSGD